MTTGENQGSNTAKAGTYGLRYDMRGAGKNEEAMKHEDFSKGLEFYTAAGKWRCTDIGTRTIVAIQIDRVTIASIDSSNQVRFEQVTDDKSWFNGPPYAVAEHVFDEFDMAGCAVGSVVFQSEIT